MLRPWRALRSWIWVAKSSLPVPVSPSSRTVESVAATRPMSSSTRATAGLRPTTTLRNCSQLCLRLSTSLNRPSMIAVHSA